MATYTGSEAITVTLVATQVDTITLTGAGTELRISQTSTTPIYIITAQPGQTPATPTVGGAGTTAIMTNYPIVLPWTGSGIVIKVISAGTGTVNFILTNSKFAPQGDLALKADLISPTFTGIPAAPTATPGTSTTQLATTAFVTTADQLLGTYTAWTPVWTANTTNPVLGDGVIQGRYCQINKTIIASGVLIPGSTTTFGAGFYKFSLPVAPAFSTIGPMAYATVYDASAGYIAYTGLGTQNTNSLLEFRIGNGLSLFNPTIPITFAESDQFRFTYVYEAA